MPKANKSTLLNEPDDRIAFFIDQATIKNTKRSTSNWLKKFNDHCKEYTLAKENSVNSVLSAIAAFQCYITENSSLKGINIRDKQQFPTLNTLLNGKFKWLSAKGKGETKGTESLTVDECLHILKHNCTSTDTPWGLFNRVFFFNALFFALRGGEHYFLEKDHFQKCQVGGYDIVIYKSKTNQ
ncbi:5503_t:CDS:2, partial [Gigaspora rosea]